MSTGGWRRMGVASWRGGGGGCGKRRAAWRAAGGGSARCRQRKRQALLPADEILRNALLGARALSKNAAR